MKEYEKGYFQKRLDQNSRKESFEKSTEPRTPSEITKETCGRMKKAWEKDHTKMFALELP